MSWIILGIKALIFYVVFCIAMALLNSPVFLVIGVLFMLVTPIYWLIRYHKLKNAYRLEKRKFEFSWRCLANFGLTDKQNKVILCAYVLDGSAFTIRSLSQQFLNLNLSGNTKVYNELVNKCWLDTIDTLPTEPQQYCLNQDRYAYIQKAWDNEKAEFDNYNSKVREHNAKIDKKLARLKKFGW